MPSLVKMIEFFLILRKSFLVFKLSHNGGRKLSRWHFCRMLRDSTPPFVGPSVRPSVGPSVRPSVTLYFFGGFAVFGLTAPAQMMERPQSWPLPTRTRLG